VALPPFSVSKRSARGTAANLEAASPDSDESHVGNPLQRKRNEMRKVLDLPDHDSSAGLHDPRVCPQLAVFWRRDSNLHYGSATGESEYRLPRNRLSETHSTRNQS
jgi:hypothetical protein